MTDLETRSRLLSMLDMLERESQTLQALEDPRLDDLLYAIGELRIELATTVSELAGDIHRNTGMR
jgi:hypothetical protein